MTALFHVPVFVAWCTWRFFLLQDHFLRLHALTLSLLPLTRLKLRRSLVWYVRTVFVLRVSLSALVIGAYCWAGLQSCFESEPGSRWRGHVSGRYSFGCIHAIIMAPAIPPIVSVTLMCYSFQWLVLLMHLVDFHKLATYIRRTVLGFQVGVLQAAADAGDIEVDLTAWYASSVRIVKGSTVTGEPVGIFLKVDNDEVIVASIESTSVFHGRLLPGQQIRSINGTALNGMAEKTVLNAVERLRHAGEIVLEVVLTNHLAPPPVCITRYWPQLSLRTRTNLALSHVSYKEPAHAASEEAEKTASEEAASAASSTAATSTTARNVDVLEQTLDDAREFEDVLTMIVGEATRRQESLNVSCKYASGPFMLLAIFNTMQFTQVFTVIAEHNVAGGAPYSWFWYLGDAFHFTVGCVLLLGLLLVYTIATLRVGKVVSIADAACAQYYLCLTRRGVLMAHLNHVLSGTHIMGVAITQEFSIMFVWGSVISIWAAIVTAITGAGL